MGVNLHQNDDGSLSHIDDISAYDLLRLGGPNSGNNVSGAVTGAPRYCAPTIVKLPISGGNDTLGGGLLHWQNTFPGDVMIGRVTLENSHSSNAACLIIAGATTSSTATANNLIDRLSVATSIGPFDNITNKGTSGATSALLSAGNYLTVSVSSGASAGLAGNLYAELFPL